MYHSFIHSFVVHSSETYSLIHHSVPHSNPSEWKATGCDLRSLIWWCFLCLCRSGRVRYALFFTLCNSSSFNSMFILDPSNAHFIILFAMTVKRAVMKSFPIHHPHESELSFLYGVILCQQSVTPGVGEYVELMKMV